MDFNEPVDCRGTHSSKWDRMEEAFGVPVEDGISMWTAASDYRTAPCVRRVLQAAVDHGVFGYSFDYPEYKAAVAWWMQARHGWTVDPDWVLTAQGLGNAVALCIDVWTDPGDGVVIFPPVYHEFANKTKNAGRVVTECPLVRDGDSYALDLDDAQARLTGNEKLLIWCSPQNPSGRIWTADELRAVSDFARRNSLILACDEIHHDLVFPGHSFVPMDVAHPEGRDITVYLTAPSKTFNIAGQRTGNLIIPDADLRGAMKKRLRSLDYSAGMLGMQMIEAAYSPEGAAWADAQMAHLEANRKLFDDGINAIPGVWSMPLQATYLPWVDFSGTGMSADDVMARIRGDAKIAVPFGRNFGTGGEEFVRFNLATQRPVIEETVRRMQRAFGDLQ